MVHKDYSKLDLDNKIKDTNQYKDENDMNKSIITKEILDILDNNYELKSKVLEEIGKKYEHE